MKNATTKIKNKIKEKLYLIKKNIFPQILHKGPSGSYSQNNQDLFVIEHFKYKEKGFFVDIGAYDGICNSNTFLLEKKYNWSGIAIEGNPRIFPYLKKNRKCQCFQACIAANRQIRSFRVFEGWCDQLSGFIDGVGPEHDSRVLKDSEYFNDKPRMIDVVPLLLEDILQSSQCQQIDYLSIDIEGNEVEILSDYLKKYPHKVKLFSFESNYTRPSKAFLNYKMIHQAGVDYFFAKT